MDHRKTTARRSLKRKLEQDFEEERLDRQKKNPIMQEPDETHQDLMPDIQAQVNILNSTFSSIEADRAAAKRAAHFLSQLAKNGTLFTLFCYI